MSKMKRVSGGEMGCGEKEIIGSRGSGDTFEEELDLNSGAGRNSKESYKQIPEADEVVRLTNDGGTCW